MARGKMKMENKYPVRIKIVGLGVTHVAYFTNVDAGKAVLDSLAAAIRERHNYKNDREHVFRFEGAGALYVISLDHIHGASLEYVNEWGDVLNTESVRRLGDGRAFRAAVAEAGLSDELERSEAMMRGAVK